MTLYFYPRPPRGGRLVTSVSSCSSSGFLSTPSARRATGTFHGASRNTPYFYPRPPRGGRPAQSLRRRRPSRISIHALREEGDQGKDKPLNIFDFISIHALREEGDQKGSFKRPSTTNFYPRPPRGGRPHAAGNGSDTFEFLSTPSARRATVVGISVSSNQGISIHALREEGDRVRVAGEFPRQEFLSTPSARRATRLCSVTGASLWISIHALREEGDVVPLDAQPVYLLFLSTPSARRAT